MQVRIEGRETYVPWFLRDKIGCFDWCNHLDLPVPNIASVFDSPAEIKLDASWSNFVLKPTKFSSTRGVMVLEVEDDGYYDFMSNRSYSFEQIVSHQQNLAERFSVRNNKWIVEERVEDKAGKEIPFDFKAYAFRGRVELLLVIDRSTKPTSVAWFDSDLKPLRSREIKLNPKYVQNLNGLDPKEYLSLVQLAKNVSGLVNSPFARIDLYNSVRGPLVGEVTLTPGGLYYGDHYEMSEAMNRLMGARWMIALDEIAETRDSLCQLAFRRSFSACTKVQRRKIVSLMNHPYLFTRSLDGETA